MFTSTSRQNLAKCITILCTMLACTACIQVPEQAPVSSTVEQDNDGPDQTVLDMNMGADIVDIGNGRSDFGLREMSNQVDLGDMDPNGRLDMTKFMSKQDDICARGLQLNRQSICLSLLGQKCTGDKIDALAVNSPVVASDDAIFTSGDVHLLKKNNLGSLFYPVDAPKLWEVMVIEATLTIEKKPEGFTLMFHNKAQQPWLGNNVATFGSNFHDQEVVFAFDTMSEPNTLTYREGKNASKTQRVALSEDFAQIGTFNLWLEVYRGCNQMALYMSSGKARPLQPMAVVKMESFARFNTDFKVGWTASGKDVDDVKIDHWKFQFTTENASDQ